MTRGNAAQTKVHHKGNTEDFIVFIESNEDLKKWKSDKSIPLAQVMSGWKVFVTHKYAFTLGSPLLEGWMWEDCSGRGVCGCEL